MSNTDIDPIFEIVKSDMNEKDKIFFITHYISKNKNYEPKDSHVNIEPYNKNQLYGSVSLLLQAAYKNEEELFKFLLNNNMGDYEYDNFEAFLKKENNTEKALHFSYTISSMLEKYRENNDMEKYLNLYFEHYKNKIHLLNQAKFDTYSDEDGENYSYDLFNLCIYEDYLDILNKVIKKQPYLMEILYSNCDQIMVNFNYMNNQECQKLKEFINSNIDFNRNEFIDSNKKIIIHHTSDSLFFFLNNDSENFSNLNIKENNLVNYFFNDLSIILKSYLNEDTINSHINDIFSLYEDGFKIDDHLIIKVDPAYNDILEQEHSHILVKKLAEKEKILINHNIDQIQNEKNIYNTNKKRI